MSVGEFFTNPQMLRLIIGTAGAWFLFDYAYYGNTLSLPSILKEVSPHAELEQKLAWSLAIFVVFAVPGYLLAIVKMDRIGHRRLQFIGFAVMALCFLALGIFPALTTTVVPFLLVFGLSYFFCGVRTEYDHFRAALGGFSGQHAYDRSWHRCRHRKARGLHRRIPRPATPTAHTTTGHVARCRRSSHSRLPPHRAATRAALKSLEEISGEEGGDVVPFPHGDPSDGAAEISRRIIQANTPVASPRLTPEERSVTVL